MELACPKCGHRVVMAHDEWEDMYRCPRRECWTFFYPEQLGLKTNQEAPIFQLGKS